MKNFASRSMTTALAALTMILIAGCDDLNLRDAFSAGVFDFVSGTVSSLLFEISPVS